MTKQEISIEYPVMEMFHTIQGEGFHAGKSAFFIRLGGCDVGCHWCDVKESWPIDTHPRLSIKTIISEARKSNTEIAVVTGGEPTMHNLEDLTHALKSIGLQTHIETSGTNTLSGEWDWVTFSPKKFKSPSNSIASLASELKIIIYNQSDLQFAQTHSRAVDEKCLLYLQPEWDRKEIAMPIIVDFIRLNPEWRISLQTHKYLQIP